MYSISFYFSSGDLDVRLGCDLCKAEQDFLNKRKKMVAGALKRVLALDEPLPEDKVYRLYKYFTWLIKVDGEIDSGSRELHKTAQNCSRMLSRLEHIVPVLVSSHTSPTYSIYSNLRHH